MDGKVISGFGNRIDPFTNQLAHHDGFDYMAAERTPVLASADGEVILAKNTYVENVSYGKYVVIDHGNGYQSLYAHLLEVDVTQGQEVKQGEVIGRSGKTGRTNGDLLHFEIHQEGGSRLGGVHAELSGENVTECIGGARGLTPAGLYDAYKSQVDPRLNYEQALEMALLISRRMTKMEKGKSR